MLEVFLSLHPGPVRIAKVGMPGDRSCAWLEVRISLRSSCGRLGLFSCARLSMPQLGTMLRLSCSRGLNKLSVFLWLAVLQTAKRNIKKFQKAARLTSNWQINKL